MQSESSVLSLEGRLGCEVRTVPALLQARAERSGDAPALWSLADNRTWRATGWKEYWDIAVRVAGGLQQLGLVPGERVGIMAPSSRYWDFLHMGILVARGVVVGLDPHDLDDNLNTVARRCDLAGLIIQEPSWLARFAVDVRKRLRFIVHFQSASDHEGMISFENLLQMTGSEPESAWLDVQPEDPATILFTSGTTGAPKGIQYTHRQVCLAVASIIEAFAETREGDHLACWLPLANLFQRILNLYAIGCGAQTYYVDDPREVMRHVGTIKPHLFIGVPRFYEKLYAGMMEKVRRGPAWQQWLVAWALEMGEQQAAALRQNRRPHGWQRLAHRLADRLVLRRLRGVMGPNLRYLVSGSAPIPVWLLERLQGMGLLVLEAYGLSENIIPVAANRLWAYRFGTVGRPLQGNTVRLAEDGELQVRGAGVFSGYYGEESAGMFDADGYLASGDFATQDAEGFITLTGRKAEIFKTSTGRRIAPAPIESVLRQAPYVEQVVVFGAGRPFPVAVLVVSAEALRLWVGADVECADLLAHCEWIRADIGRCLAALPEAQRPAGLVVTTRPFTVESGELTTNLKMRRRVIEARYGDVLDALYQTLAQASGRAVQETVDGEEGEVVLCSL